MVHFVLLDFYLINKIENGILRAEVIFRLIHFIFYIRIDAADFLGWFLKKEEIQKPIKIFGGLLI